MSDRSEDKELEHYLHRKSALSLGYKKIYVESPPPELDRAVTARARRALRWLAPAILAATISISLFLLTNSGVGKFMDAWVRAHQPKETVTTTQQPAGPMMVTPIDSTRPATVEKANIKATAPTEILTPEKWQAKIDALRKAGNNAAADAEQLAFDKAFPKK